MENSVPYLQTIQLEGRIVAQYCASSTLRKLVLFEQDFPPVRKVASAKEQNPRILIVSVTKLLASVDVQFE